MKRIHLVVLCTLAMLAFGCSASTDQHVAGSEPLGSENLQAVSRSYCGNGVVGVREQCDDGNLTSGDGCSSACRLEPTPTPPPTSGWTQFTASSDTRTVYVSSSTGNDNNDGLSPTTPKRTIAAGITFMRNNYPDWLLLKRGDVWNEALGQWKKAGRSQSEPMLVSSYGVSPDRPLLRTGTATTCSRAIWTNGGGGSAPRIDNFALVGIEFRPAFYDGDGDCPGAEMLLPSSHTLFEDLKFVGYSTNLVVMGYGGPQIDFKIRRSVIANAHEIHGTGNHSSGLYASDVQGFLIEENVWDHNGWSESVPGAGADIFTHGIYIQNSSMPNNTGGIVEFRGNIMSNSSSHGIQLRCGGVIENNLFVRNSISLLVGGGNTPDPGGVLAEVRRNVILDGKNIDANNPRGWGMNFSNIQSGLVDENIIANNTLGTQPSLLSFDGASSGSSGVRNLQIQSNIFYNWGGTFQAAGNAPGQVSNITFVDNDYQNPGLTDTLLVHSGTNLSEFTSGGNRFFSAGPASQWTRIDGAAHTIGYWMQQAVDTTSVAQSVTYPNPNSSVGSYNASLGGASTHDAFMTEALKQSRSNWRPQYTADAVNAYIRAGFGMP